MTIYVVHTRISFAVSTYTVCAQTLFYSKKRAMTRERVDLDRKLRSTLREVFKYENFREGQLEASRAILSRKDVFVRMRTSGGKSLCYLLPAMVLSGSCIVVSPLISLMDDQVPRI